MPWGTRKWKHTYREDSLEAFHSQEQREWTFPGGTQNMSA